ncbi:putative Cytochrome c-type biogenesis protein CcmC, heme lyase for CcmE [Candidatus Hydrogenisulfobacillus filiaventi]|uniref:Heme exporter protein C n=1 Tax=Candidatus Hydrogenisulfobacillus filiaventi TaxID=2707344 RepID=A0A6F8ZGZ3_9FIRM|nr:cytochrome c biogenesis protein CcsA [Bacillota bacterium]CAB1128983.1 putative Cytochrome c-type biogenesis protein CcmC, heme lyase for CcmE [Candidatus Hydrogenisulfobacillus filiaventi]
MALPPRDPGRVRDRWVWLLLPFMWLVLYVDFIWSPDDVTLGPTVRIFYFHMGSATVAGLAFTVTAVASALYLWRRRPVYDRWAAASAEIGTVFTAIVLASGILWGKAAWGIWWTWDPRLTSTVILWVLFGGYLLLREWSDNPERRARYSAVLALAAYVDVPIDYMTIRWWHSIHPVVITARGINMAPPMIAAMFLSMAALIGVYIVWMIIRLRLARAEALLNRIKAWERANLAEGE